MMVRPPPTRGLALFCFASGIALFWFNVHLLRTSGKFYGTAFFLLPAMTILGSLGLAFPPLLNPWHRELRTRPDLRWARIVHGTLLTVSLMVGLYAWMALLADLWLPEWFVALIRPQHR